MFELKVKEKENMYVMQVKNTSLSETYITYITKEELKEKIRNVFLWQYNKSDSFSIKLIELIAKADYKNMEKLLKAFPEQTIAYMLWYDKPDFLGTSFEDEEDFFRYFGVVI